MRIRTFALLLPVLLLAFTAPAFGQVLTGTPPFASTDGGPDIIDLGNLNAHINIPIRSKAGRAGMSFTYTLSYDTSVWYPAPSGSTNAWFPVVNWGWRGQTEVVTGYVSDHYQFQSCVSGRQRIGTVTTYSNWTYHDTFGVFHSFVGDVVVFNVQPGYSCEGYSGDGNSGPLVATTTDGSGYTLNAKWTGTALSATITPRRGGAIISPFAGSGTGTATDRNGNEISENSSGVFTDTLGQTVLTVAGSGTPTSPITYTYAAPSGANAVFTQKYTSYTVQTNFACSGITEYSASSVNLITEIDLPDQGTYPNDKYTFTYEQTPGNPSNVTGRLASVTLPAGGKISYTYSGGGTGVNGITCADGSAATIQRSTPDTGSNYWTYAHSESGSAGTTLVTDPQGNQTNLNFQGIYETERQVYQGSTSGTLLKTVYTCYNGATSGCNSTAITLPISEISVSTLWPGTNGLESRTNVFYNSYGSITEKDEYAYGPNAPGSVVRKTLTTYASLGNGIVAVPATVTVEDGSSNIKSQTTYCYDEGVPSGTTTCAATGAPTATSGTPQHVAITGSRGNVTTIAQLVQGSTTLGKTYTYYDTGNVNVATDVNGGTTTPAYSSTGSCGNSFATSVAEAVTGLSRSVAWNCVGGVETSVTDESGQITSYNYTTDPYFWRPNSSTDPLSNTTNYTYTPETSSAYASGESSLTFGSGSAVNILKSVDGLGRTLLSQQEESPTSATWDSVETDYDSLGRPTRVTLPFAGSKGSTNSSAASTQTTYDTLGRRSQVTDSSGKNLQFTYSQNDTYRTLGPAPTGEHTKQKQFEYDALGRITSVCEVTTLTGSGTCGQTSTATGYWTQYTYDVLNDLAGVTQNAQSSTRQTRTYSYDGLGRLTSEVNPETGTTATAYTYDTDGTCGTSKGDLVKKVDQVGNTICFAYDKMHRVTSTTYPSGSYASVSPSRYFVYDSATVNSVVMANAKGHMAEAYTCTGTCSSKITDAGLSYTVRGEVSDVYESTPHSGGYNHSSATYWANGVLDTLSGAVGYFTSYGLDGEGRVSSAGSGQQLTSTTYNAASEPLVVTFGSGDTDTFTYDPNSNRMTGYTLSVNNQLVTGTLTWNSIATLEKLATTDAFNSPNAQTCNYAHDDLSRIASDNCGSGWSQTFTYDAFGNISKTGSQSFLPTYSSSTNRMTLIGSNTPAYDANGNVTNDFLNSYSWDSNARPVTVNGVGITYDALGRAAEMDKSGTYTQIVYSPTGFKMQLLNGSALVKEFVPMPAGTAEVWTPTANYYRHSDWLGSSRLASTTTRTIYYDGAYGPFGEQYANTGTTDLSFTGMNQDTSSNVYDFPAREYGIQGRWPSPDPAGISAVKVRDPQTWNRYAYVRNSPLNSTDPTGLCQELKTRADNAVYAGCGGDGAASCPECVDVAAGVFDGPTEEGATQPGDPSDPSGSGPTDPNSNPCGTCVYLNATGTGLDDQANANGSVNPIDKNSNANECQQTGGVFAPQGYGVGWGIANIQADSESNEVVINYYDVDNIGYGVGVPGGPTQLYPAFGPQGGWGPGPLPNYGNPDAPLFNGNLSTIYNATSFSCATNFNIAASGLGIASLATGEMPPVAIGLGLGGIAAGWIGQKVCQ